MTYRAKSLDECLIQDKKKVIAFILDLESFILVQCENWILKYHADQYDHFETLVAFDTDEVAT